MVLICQKEGTTAGIMARARDSEQGLGSGVLANSLPGTRRHSLRARPWLLRPAPAKPLNEEGLFPSTGLARGECGTNIRFLSVLQCEADDKIITSPRGYRLKISAGSRRVLRVLWNAIA